MGPYLPSGHRSCFRANCTSERHTCQAQREHVGGLTPRGSVVRWGERGLVTLQGEGGRGLCDVAGRGLCDAEGRGLC